MRMITPHGLAAAGRRMNISTMSLNLTERSSTANMSLSDLSGIQIADMVTSWFLDDEQPGKNIVWRARNISRAYHSDTSTIQLEHIINVLRDTIIFGEVKTEDISAWAGKDKKAKKVSARDAVRYALHFQNDWVLGTFDYDDEVNPYAFDGETVYDALEYVSASLEDAFWSYDMTTYPFTLNITNNNSSKLPKNSQSIMRAGRNLNTITRNIDKSGMYTRFYATGKDDLKMEFGKDKTPYRDRNTTKYGIIEHAEQDNSLTTQEQLQFWALTKLRKHDAPVVTIDVDGLELADATGESVDRFTLGMLCRVPLPEFSTTIEEKIVGLSYSDKKNQPESVKVSLSNKREDVTKIIAQQTQAARRSSRVQQRQNKSTMEIVRNTIKEVQIAGPDKNNQYKLQYKLVTDTDWKDAPVNFSRAVTSWNVGKVADGQIRVTAKPQEQYKDVYVRAGTITRQKVKDKFTNIYKGPIQYSENKTAWSSTGAEIEVNATDSYNDGRTFGIDEGRKQVYVKSVALATGYSYLNDTGERTVVEIEGTSGIKDSTVYDKTLEKPFKLAQTKYNSQSSYCVELLQWNASDRAYTDKIGRVNIDNVWQLGWNAGNEAGQDSVTVDRIALADNYQFLGDTRGDIRWQIYIQGTASNGAKKDDTYFTLTTQVYVNRSRYCAELRQWNSADHAFTNIIGRIDIQSVYETGRREGWQAAWSSVQNKTYDVDNKTYNYNPVTTVTESDRLDYIKVARPGSTVDSALYANTYYVVTTRSNAYIRAESKVGAIVAVNNDYTYDKGYDKGWDAAYDACTEEEYEVGSDKYKYNPVSTVPENKRLEYIKVARPTALVDGGLRENTYYVATTKANAYIRAESKVGAIVAKNSDYTYNSGWQAAWSSVQNKTYEVNSKTYNYNPVTTVAEADRIGYIKVARPNGSVDGALTENTYYVVTTKKSAYIRAESKVGAIVAANNDYTYNAGWKAAWSSVQNKTYEVNAKSYNYNPVTTVADADRLDYIKVIRPNGTVDGGIESANTNTYYVTIGTNRAYIRAESKVGAIVAQASIPSPDYDVDFVGVGTFASSVSPASVLAGWSPEQISGVGDSEPNMYRYIKFKVDGKQRSFYFA